ncbi:hypothetical protein UA08_05743 [Talaromyces atroroseus]|uniref:AB hydrolase-1 domain-containing protein n=1 Tax=Talaromyces atroroseus TaxID=1441469 RepID=A0A225AW58_TALAT|nr:hypothetical protein UA08_05743 [Talaromyces atroroseus]OKL59196.1 hypothetical protein UA08_05743 [Talaromyces atroroseus]
MTSKWQVTSPPRNPRYRRSDPLVLIPGLPQTAEAFSDIFEPVSKHYQFLALDHPGLGDSLPPVNGYDTANVSKVMAEAIHDILKERQCHLVGHGNLEYAKTPLDIPVLALGGASSVGSGMINLVQNFAANVSGGAIDDYGHFLPEEQPSAVMRRLLELLDTYQNR